MTVRGSNLLNTTITNSILSLLLNMYSIVISNSINKKVKLILIMHSQDLTSIAVELKFWIVIKIN